MTAYLYGRVSHRASGASGISEVNQFQKMTDYRQLVLPDSELGLECYPADYPCGLFFDKSVSAWRVPFSLRPAGASLCEILKPGDDVVFYSVDRGFRNVRSFCIQVEDWVKRGINPHFVVDNINLATPVGKLRAHVMASIAQYYSDIISARTKEALRIKRLLKMAPDKAAAEKTIWLDSESRMPTSTKPKRSKKILHTGTIYRYARCSHFDSMLSGLGMEHQIRSITSYADRLAADRPGLLVHPEVFADESISAFSVEFGDRPQGKRLLGVLKPGDQIVVYRVDRGWRMPHDAMRMCKELAKQGIGIHIVDAGIDSLSDDGQMWIGLMSMFAHLESQIKSRRSLEVAEHCRQTGRPYSPTPSHMKIVRSGKCKKLSYDFEKITMFALCWICRVQLGMPELDACDVVHAIDCAVTDSKPVSMPNRRGRWGGRGRLQDGIKRFELLKTVIPAEALDECVSRAASMLEERIDEKYTKLCKVSLPIQNVTERITERIAGRLAFA